MNVSQNVSQRIEAMGQGMRHSGRGLWLASLGTAASVEQGSRRLFDRLVARGEARKDKGLNVVPTALEDLTAKVGGRVKGLGQRAEERLEEGVTSAMKRFGMPIREDFEVLIDRIEQLSRKVDDLAKG